jgi:hypothetical protein
MLPIALSLFMISESLCVTLGGLMVSVLVIGHNVRELKPAEGDGSERAIKLRSTPSFGGQVKPLDPYCKILRHVKEPYDI